VDADADGECSIESGGSDCNDADADEYPGHRELCDLHDEDCDPSTLGPDEDGDGFVSDACCNPQPGGGTLCGSDCDDANPRVSPLAVEICDGIDNDCNGAVDDGVNVKLYADVDGDGLGNPDCEAALCPGTPGFVGNSFDCDDTTRAQTLCSPSAEGQVLLCESGVWTVADCPFGTTCISQPDGSGVCQR
jgi:hypothetical protein